MSHPAPAQSVERNTEGKRSEGSARYARLVRSPLSEILLREHLVTPEQLKQALEAQARWGIRVGSSLLRLGILDYNSLARALSLHFGVPAALERDFEHLSPEAFARIPRRLSEKYLAVPLALSQNQGRLLSVALADPTRVAAVDEIAFAAGIRIAVSVAPEVRLLEALEAQYGILEGDGIDPRWRERRESLDRTTSSEMPLVLQPRTPGPLPPPPSALWLVDEEPPVETFSGAQAPPTDPADELLDAWRLLLDPTTRPPTGEIPLLSPEPVSAEILLEEVVGEISVARLLSATEAAGRIAHASSREEVGQALLGYLRGCFAAGVVFVVRGGLAHARWGFGPRMPAGTVAKLSVPLSPPSCLRAAYAELRAFSGPPPREGITVHSIVWKALGADSAPREVIVAPLLAQSRVVGLVYAHPAGSSAVPPGRGEELGRLCVAASTALIRLSR